MSKNLFYFTEDGTYGQADGNFRVFDTSGWTDDDWLWIEECSDNERLEIATHLANRTKA